MKTIFLVIMMFLSVGINAQKPQFVETYNFTTLKEDNSKSEFYNYTKVIYNVDNKPYIYITSGKDLEIVIKITSETYYKDIDGVRWQIVEAEDKSRYSMLFAYNSKYGCILFFDNKIIAFSNR